MRSRIKISIGALVPAAVLAVALVPAATAGAAAGGPDRAVTVSVAAQAAVGELADSLPGSVAGFGGVWIGADDRLKVGLVGVAAADSTARPTGDDATRLAAEGATVRRLAAGRGLDGATDVVVVRHSMREIEAGSQWLAARLEQANRGATLPMLSGQWLAANAVELRLPADGGLTEAQRQLVTSAQAKFGALLVIGSYAGRVEANACNLSRCDPPIRGGIRIDGNQPCSLGFLARGRVAGNIYAITAGHCSGSTWYMATSDGSRRIGDVTARRFSGGGDGAIIHVANTDFWRPRPWVYVAESGDTTLNKQYEIRDDGRSVEGMRICYTGAFGGTDCGRVQRLNMSVEYNGVIVHGLGEADFCSIGGDSGGPVYAGHVAYGLDVAAVRGASPCRSFYQGIRGAEDFLNVDVIFAG